MVSHSGDPAAFEQFSAPFPNSSYVVGVRKGDTTLRKVINKRLKQMAKSGELAKINRKWFGKQYDKKQLPLIIK